MKIDLSGIRTYEIDLKNGVLKSEGVDDHARMLEALAHLKSSSSLPVAPFKEESVDFHAKLTPLFHPKLTPLIAV